MMTELIIITEIEMEWIYIMYITMEISLVQLRKILLFR